MLHDILEPMKPLFPAGDHVELRGQVNRQRRIVLVQGNLIENSRTDTKGVSARVYKNGVYGFSSMAEYSEDAARAVLKEASDNAAFMNTHAAKDAGALPLLHGEGHVVQKDIHNAEQGVYINFIQKLDEYITEKCPGITGRTVTAVEDSMEKLLKTSDGVDGHTILPRSYVYVTLNAETSDGMPVELYDVMGGMGTVTENFTDPADCYATIDKLYENIMKKKEGVYADAGYHTVILDGRMTGMLSHEAVGHTVEADLVQAGSVASTRLNKQVASDKITMTDFAHTAFGETVPLPIYQDDEGTQALDAPLIENGILTGYMNNRETAAFYNMQPTGNARAWMFYDEPLIRMRNTAIHPGTDKLEDMIASVENGYYLIQSGNGQADMTGEFMFGIGCGYEIKNGKLGRALFDTTVSGIAFEMLKTVDMVSDTLTWASSGFCGKKQMIPVSMGGPALRCKLMIGGR